jgi:hypothetical protein
MKRFSSLLLFLGIASMLSAQECDGPTAIGEFGANQIHVRLGHGGSFWNANQDGWGMWLPEQVGGNLLYTAGLIIGGISPDQQLKLAGAGYDGNGTDFYAGPLSTDGTATSSLENCLNWDRFFVIYEQHVQRHKEYFDCMNNPDCDLEELFPVGYIIPESFLEYPAHGDNALNQDFYLAPFYDYNSDGTYDPSVGDAPYFISVYGGDDCCNSLKGHVCAFWIANDTGGPHLYSNSEPIGLEIQHMTYAYSASNYLGRSLFHQEMIINRGTQTLMDTHVGHFLDFDLGSPNDDLFGSDSTRQAVYVYNGDNYDEPSFEASSFESRIPAGAWVQLGGPWEDPDNEDGDNDGIIDNETVPMSHVIGTDVNVFPNFTVPANFYNYLRSYLSNGAHYTENNEAKDFQWEAPIEEPEIFGDIPPFDVKMIASSGAFTLEPGDSHCLNHAFTYHRPQEDAPATASLAFLGPQVDSLHVDFDACFPCIPPAVNIQVEEISPGVYAFFNLAGAEEYAWDFGDGAVSDFAFPTHTYSADGIYNVTLQLENACGSASGSLEIDALASSVVKADELTAVSVYPNPAREALTISGLGVGRSLIRIYEARGKLVWELTGSADQVEVPVSNWDAGLYMITIDSKELSTRVTNSRQLRFVVE